MANMHKPQKLLADTVAGVAELVQMVLDRTNFKWDIVGHVSTLASHSYQNATSHSDQYLLGLAGQVVGQAQARLAITRTAPEPGVPDTSHAVLTEVVDRLRRLQELAVANTTKDLAMLRETHRLALEAALDVPEHEANLLDIAAGLLAAPAFDDRTSGDH
jgi:hypothetical protein